MKASTYLLVKDKYSNETVFIDYDKINGFTFKPQNQKNYDGITVNKMLMIKPSFIEKILKRKVKNKLDIYLKYIIDLLDSDDESTGISGLGSALNDLTRYKSIVMYNYRKYLDDKYIDLLLKKISLLEHELKQKILSLSEEKENEEVQRKSR